ncbi:DUF4367 domain-containing protein [Paenibacillus sp. QZ-Y1]|uniref:DUF4367 domain-containing protein n=1 Tax=Paenibacillus sp. QZ-Y1 TaxID=3414511 RepID=UPI003F78F9F1
MSLSYRSERGSFHLQVFGTTKTRIHIPDAKAFQIERVNVRGHEGYYISDAGQRKLVWIEEDSGGKALQYEITGNDFSKARVLGIAESMME